MAFLKFRMITYLNGETLAFARQNWPISIKWTPEQIREMKIYTFNQNFPKIAFKSYHRKKKRRDVVFTIHRLLEYKRL